MSCISMIRLSIVLLAVIMIGCSLSKGKHLNLISEEAKRKDATCGYFDNSITFGDENESIISIGGAEIEFCSIDYKFQIVAEGFIVPLYPVNGYEHSKNIRWVRITNRKATPISISGKDDALLANLSRYPDSASKALSNLNQDDRHLKKDQYIWVGFPIQVSPELYISISGKKSIVSFSEGISLSWFLITY